MTEAGRIDEEVAFWIHKYLLLCGEAPMSGLGDKIPGMSVIATAFYGIGWEDIMHGRLPLAL